MEYEDFHNIVKANQFAALSALKTGDLSFIICRVGDSQKSNGQMDVDKNKNERT